MASLRPVPVGAVTVRPATPVDAPALYPLWQRARQWNASRDPRVRYAPVEADQFAVALQSQIALPTATVLLALNGEQLAGFVSGAIEAAGPDRIPDRHATIGYLWVDPPFRRRGIARDLLDALRAWASSQDGVSHLEMPVLAADEDAARFWAAMGFRPFITRLWAPVEPTPEHGP